MMNAELDLEPLLEWLRIPSVSADPGATRDVRRAGEWVLEYLNGFGASCRLLQPAGATHPFVAGVVPASERYRDAPRVLLYGHFDVQPPGDQDAWTTPPFSPEVRDGWLYARGAADAKGNLFIMLAALRRLALAGCLPVEVEVVVDGEEEIDGSAATDYVRQCARVDAAIVWDGAMCDAETPAFVVSCRGTLFYSVEVITGEQDLHSGLYGGAALNAAHALVLCLAPLVADPVLARRQPDAAERASWARLTAGTDALRAAGAVATNARAASEFYDRTLLSTVVDVNGLAGGDALRQATVIPNSARAHLSVRVAPGHDLGEIDARVRQTIETATPAGAHVAIDRRVAIPPGETAPDSVAVALAASAFEQALGTAPMLVRSGASIPIVAVLQELEIPVLMTGFALPDSRMHGADERLLLRLVDPGASAAEALLASLGSLRRHSSATAGPGC